MDYFLHTWLQRKWYYLLCSHKEVLVLMIRLLKSWSFKFRPTKVMIHFWIDTKYYLPMLSVNLNKILFINTKPPDISNPGSNPKTHIRNGFYFLYKWIINHPHNLHLNQASWKIYVHYSHSLLSFIFFSLIRFLQVFLGLVLHPQKKSLATH